ncbi:peptidylprolyl isomerase [Desulfobacula phenolica]|uniref:Peptidyl-prolyl cis-trans isomerase C n=1 Tax=Desulfobacula phenolica TaxID=90732 RepID=A0A1H2DPR3_9BACT|nr:peptidylprolyl isomerase [Desulfobacula phenolica]SDT84358.1 peptidyl-prolyl cis-trans isomerase C [Desulfobacula phenolica]
MKKIPLIICLIPALFIGLFYGITAAASSLNDEVQSDEKEGVVVAVINGSKIYRAALDLEVKSLTAHLLSLGDPVPKSDEPEIRKKALESLINAEILYTAGLKAGYDIDAALIDQEIQQVKDQFETPADYQKMLESIHFTENQLRRHFKKGLVVKNFVEQEFEKKVIVTPRDIRQYYTDHPEKFNRPEEVKASHILIKLDENATPAQKINAKKEIETILAQIKAGKDFATLAKALSQCPSNSDGGDLGYFKRGVMEKSFEDAAFSLEPGQSSGIVLTSFGYHIITVTGKKLESTVPFEKAEKRIQRHLTLHRSKALLDKFVDLQRQSATIDIEKQPEA